MCIRDRRRRPELRRRRIRQSWARGCRMSGTGCARSRNTGSSAAFRGVLRQLRRIPTSSSGQSSH
eukprot:2323382-Alexandrium_andersonii.AAC.1